MKKEYLIFDLDWTLIESMSDTVKIITNYLKQIPNTDFEKVRYVFSTTPWMALKKQIELIYNWYNDIDSEKITLEIYEQLLKQDANFFEWIIEKIKELSNNYKLFLTTWNSTEVAIKYLTEWWIKDKFELIYWSDKILKWKDHLEIFKEYSLDKDFYRKSFYIWDWNSDREFAKSCNIDFIHVWNSKIYKYEIDSVKDIDIILSNY